MELPIKVEGILFAKVENDFKFLILKRSKEEGNYWQPLTGTVSDDESLKQTLLRELDEELGIKNIKSIVKDVYHFNWEWDGEVYLEFVYGIELYLDQEIKLSQEHSEFKWVKYETAVEMIKKENNKKAFAEFNKIVMQSN